MAATTEQPGQPGAATALERSSSSTTGSTNKAHQQQQQQQQQQQKKQQKHQQLPCISIHLERLMGYQPRSQGDVDDEELQEELESIRSQLIEAMWTRYQDSTSDGYETAATDRTTHPPPDFDVQAMEFFETGVARYEENDVDDEDAEAAAAAAAAASGTSISRDYSNGRLKISYPPYLQSPVTGERFSTRDIVQQITQQPHHNNQQPVDSQQLNVVVNTVWKYLRQCSRPLLWKRDMSRELSRLIQEEQARLDYQEWTETKRQPKLDHLYSVRETLVHQVDLAKEKVELLEEERDLQVREAMELLRRQVEASTKNSRNKDSMEAFGTTELSFPDEFQWLGLRDEPVDEKDDWGLSSSGQVSDDSYGSNDGSEADWEISDNHDQLEEPSVFLSGDDDIDGQTEFPLEEFTSPAIGTVPMPTVEEMETELGDLSKQDQRTTQDSDDAQQTLSLPFQKRKQRREQSKRRKRKERQTAEQKAQLEKLQKMEEGLRSQLTNNELILAQTMHNALTEKMTKIEDLLNSLQDEVWQAEEETEGNDSQTHQDKDTTDPAFSLLDQVLAMILGATPIPDETNPAKHYERMQQEHQAIVQAWKAHFGRLPTPTTGSSERPSTSDSSPPDAPLSSQEYRKELGISENDGDDDWEAVKDWDDLLNDKASNANKSPSGAKVPTEKSKKENPKKASTESVGNQNPPGPKLVGLRPGGRALRPSQS